jgi:hypothetical protein
MKEFRDAPVEGRIECWGAAEPRNDIGFCSQCDHPLVGGVCLSCGSTHCPLCGEAVNCAHALPAIERRETSSRAVEDEDEELLEDLDDFEDLDEESENPPEHLDGVVGASFHSHIDRRQSPGPGLAFRTVREGVRWHGGWREGIPDPFQDESILYETIHDARLHARLEEEVWTRAARRAGAGLVAVERVPVGGLSSDHGRKRLWFSNDRDPLLEAGRALEADWEHRVAEIEESVRSKMKYPECPLCGVTTYHTYEDGLLSCGECGAWECPYCGVNSIGCGSGCPHSLGLVVDGSLYDSQIDLSVIPVSELSLEQSAEVGESLKEEIFGDLYPVLDVYDFDPTERPYRAYLMLALAEHACPDVHVECFFSPHGSMRVPLCRDIELGKRQFESALSRLADAMRRFDALAPATPRDIDEED